MPVTPFRPATDTWFREAFGQATTIQSRGWPAIRTGRHGLLIAPTGSGKTLAAFLSAIDRLIGEPAPDTRRGYSVLYISPLKALATDVERNLRAPLTGIIL
ncbi:MAG: DEAD/DEAH box helicase, partial [Thioalkalivibrio sp.]|nr:DEAD/DEAH box helicase [Thioalkalivibrio sp.]